MASKSTDGIYLYRLFHTFLKLELLIKQEVVFQGRVLLLSCLEHPYLFLPYQFLLDREAVERTLTLTLFEESKEVLSSRIAFLNHF